MKRKRGNKKGKQKQSDTAVNVENTEDTSLLEDQDFDNAELDSEMEIQVPVPIEPDEMPNKPIINNTHPDGFTDNKAQARVRVKLKSSRLLEPQRALSDAQTQSDTDKSSSHLSLERQEEQPTVSGNSYRKGGNIKIKSSRGIIASLSTPNGSLQGQGDQTVHSTSDIHKTIGQSRPKEQKFSHQVPRYNEKELNTALQVIRKIMKMDAAEPFNAPVDPIALGIPDYFDIIETPMDFSTVCNNIEQGHTYNNSEDVYKDVQYIWENCYKYNNKGDYIVDLMKRVKKNFMKYWTAAGLYTSQPNKTNVSERLQAETVAPSSQEKVHVKGTHSKHKKRGRHGFNKHKSDCLCAVCVVRRRSKERERNAKDVETRIEISDGNTRHEFKQEESCLENHYSEDASSNLGHSSDPDADADMEEQSEKMKLERHENQGSPQQEIEIQKTSHNYHSDQFQLDDGSGEEPNPQSQSEEMEDSGIMIRKHNSEDDIPSHQKEEAIEIQKLQQKHDSQMMQQHTIMCENLLLDRNPSIMKLCGTLFPNSRNSLWSGPHSLGYRDVPVRNRSSAIHAAVEMFMK